MTARTPEALDVASLVREEEGLVHRRVYTDPALYELEQQRIFGTTWVYVGHTSEVPGPGAYRRAALGRQPVVVSRDEAGAVHVLYNRCRHRGATVCQEERGRSAVFRCAYHGWTYSPRGELVGVPFRQGYGGGFDASAYGLVPVARVDQYRGFIFASAAAQGPSLEEHLGAARAYIDQFVEAAPTGEIAATSGAHKSVYPGNWKLQLENAVDGYHPGYLHHTLFELRRQRGLIARSVAEEGFPNTVGKALGNGHAVLDRLKDTDPRTREARYDQLAATPDGARFVAELEAQVGPEQARVLASEALQADFNLAIFPNLVLINAQIRTIQPLAVDRTQVTVQPVLLGGVPAAVNARRLRLHEEFYGPAGLAAPDDFEMFARVQEGLQVEAVEWLLLARGQEREWAEGSVRVCPAEDETHQRAQYAHWKRCMLAGEA